MCWTNKSRTRNHQDKSYSECDGFWSTAFDENQNRSPKARVVILGYLDPDYEKQTSSISNSDEKHQTVVVANWCMDGIFRREVSGAFLQGRKLQRDLCVLPAPELAAALDVSPG